MSQILLHELELIKDGNEYLLKAGVQAATNAEYTTGTSTELAPTVKQVKDSIAVNTAAIAAVDAKVTGVYKYVGTVANMTELEAVVNPSVGDVYNVIAAANNKSGENYAWNGTKWDDFGGIVDTSSFATTAYVDDELATKQDTLVAGNNVTIAGVTITANIENILASADDITNNVTTKSPTVHQMNTAITNSTTTLTIEDIADSGGKKRAVITF